ncbi:hypothetical protein BHE74_00011607 [Ensete ventricosum]|nr:hypothetical protein BHE74_00011607 [Ensete ventricosum]RZR93316.1 hypothetical protein BHM03_00021782 [Ensete ventricosum]
MQTELESLRNQRREFEQEVRLLRFSLDGAQNDLACLEGVVLSLIEAMTFLKAELKAEAPCVYHDASDVGVSNTGRNHQGIVVVRVFALGFEGESQIASWSGPLVNFRARIGLPCRGAKATHSWATHYDVNVPFHRSLRTEGWLVRLPYVSVEVAAVHKVLDLVLQIIALLSVVLVVAVEATITSAVSVFGSRPHALATLAALFLAPNVVSPPPCPVDPYNGVRAASTRGAPRWQSKVDVCGYPGCDFNAGLSNLAGLFLQYKTSRVVDSRGGPSDDQVRVDSKGEVCVLNLGTRASSPCFLIEVEKENESTRERGALGFHFYTCMSLSGQDSASSFLWHFLPARLMSPIAPAAIRVAGCILTPLCCRVAPSGYYQT